MPTINELKNIVCEGIPPRYDSVAFGDVRTILNHLDEPVLAYAYGMGGFIAIYPMRYGFARAVGYSGKFMYTSSSEPGFYVLDAEYALKKIKAMEYCKKGIDEKRLKKALTKEGHRKEYLGKFRVKDAYSENEHLLYKQKNGKIIIVRKRIVDRGESRYRWKLDSKEFMKLYLNVINKGTDEWDKKCELIENTIPKEVIKKLELQYIAERID